MSLVKSISEADKNCQFISFEFSALLEIYITQNLPAARLLVIVMGCYIVVLRKLVQTRIA